MYIKLNNGVIEKYPYSIGDLRKANPNTSFPKNPSNELLAEWGVFPVEPVGAPSVDHTKNVKEGTPVNNNGWKQTWTIVDASQQEVSERVRQQEESVRSDRNQRIAESDWTQLDDTPLTNAKKLEWATYRQALRDIPAQAGFPWNVSWPTKP